MSNVMRIIADYRQRLETAGLLRPMTAAKLSKQVAAMRPSLTKARAALQERPPVVQPSPMAILFETALPKLEPLLIELGEERAEQIIGRLCEHGTAMIEEYGDEAKEHLEELFKDLPNYEAKLRDEKGIEEIIELYWKSGGDDGTYLRLKLGDKIAKLAINDDGMISLKLASSITDSDLIHLRRVRNFQELDLSYTQVSNLTFISGLTGLQRLNLWGTRVSDFKPLSGLTSLQMLNLGKTQISDVTPLSGLTSLQVLGLNETQVNDLTPLSGLTSLQGLNLRETKVSDARIEELKRAIPGLRVLKW